MKRKPWANHWDETLAEEKQIKSLVQIEREYFEFLYLKFKGNIRACCRVSGMSKVTFEKRLKLFGIVSKHQSSRPKIDPDPFDFNLPKGFVEQNEGIPYRRFPKNFREKDFKR